MDNDNRSLTDADVEAVADQIWCRAKKEFFLNVGKGFVGYAWRGFLLILLMLAAYGAGKHGFN